MRNHTRGVPGRRRACGKPAGHWIVAAAVLSWSLFGCGDDDAGGGGAGAGASGTGSVDLTGLSDADAAGVMAGALCGWLAECGQSIIACDIPQGGGTTCGGGVEPVDLTTCSSEKTPALLADLSCLGRTAQLDAQLAECINAQVEGPCITQADVDTHAELLEQFFDGTGADPGPITAWPEVCEELRTRIQTECTTDGEELTLTCSSCY